jgi:hypothetical protein
MCLADTVTVATYEETILAGKCYDLGQVKEETEKPTAFGYLPNT